MCNIQFNKIKYRYIKLFILTKYLAYNIKVFNNEVNIKLSKVYKSKNKTMGLHKCTNILHKMRTILIYIAY